MRHNFMNMAGGALTLLLALAAPSAQADIIAQDNAGNYATWTNNSNQGSGFQPWSFMNGSNSGFFLSSSTGNGGSPGIDTSGQSFGIFANSGDTATANRKLNTALAVGQTFNLAFDNGSFSGSNGPNDGFSFNDASGNLAFKFQLYGGDSLYRFTDSNGFQSTGLSPTTGGIQTSLTLTGANTYAFSAKELNGGATFTHSGTLFSGSSGISQLFVFNTNAGGGSGNNLYVNSLSVTTPAPSALLPMAGGLTVLFGSLKRRKRK